MRVLITGGNGFLGGKIGDMLREEGHEVISYDIAEVEKNDVLDYGRLCAYFSKYDFDLVVHCAAVLGIQNVWVDPFKTLETNIIGLYNVIKVMQFYGVRRLINFSSSEIYGVNCLDYKETDFASLGPYCEKNRWCYGTSKFASEYLAQASGLNATTIRPFNIYGPGQKNGGFLFFTINRALNGEDIIINGTGKQVRSWCYIDDFMDAVGLLIREEHCGLYNVGNPTESISILALARMVKEFTGSSSKIVFREHEIEDVYMRSPNVDKIGFFGWEPSVPIGEGLEKTIVYYRDGLLK